MDEYIKRETALTLLQPIKGKGIAIECVNNTIAIIREAFNKIPAAEVAPVIHAHVVTNWLGDCHCSNCGDYCDATKPFCAECGARFDEPETYEE